MVQMCLQITEKKGQFRGHSSQGDSGLFGCRTVVSFLGESPLCLSNLVGSGTVGEDFVVKRF